MIEERFTRSAWHTLLDALLLSFEFYVCCTSGGKTNICKQKRKRWEESLRPENDLPWAEFDELWASGEKDGTVAKRFESWCCPAATANLSTMEKRYAAISKLRSEIGSSLQHSSLPSPASTLSPLPELSPRYSPRCSPHAIREQSPRLTASDRNRGEGISSRVYGIHFL